MKRLSMRVVVLVFVCLASLAICRADETAAITGLVTDPAGRSVPGVKLTITNLSTNVESSTQTNDQGIYRVEGIQPGIYRITVLKDGFKSIVKSNLELHVQDVASINFELEVGSVSETVTVSGDQVNLNTTDGSVSTVVNRQFVENMPLNGRSFQDLLTLAPGVTLVGSAGNGGNSGVGNGGEFTVNGQRTEANYFTVDGISANTGTVPQNSVAGAGYSGSTPGETMLGTTQSLVSVDDLEEFRATTSTYSAEYGRTPGGQFSFITRSGSNEWHGSAYDYFRNDVLDANNWFNDYFDAPKTAERQNDFGGTLGGPLEIPGLYDGKDKTFFFFSYEGLRLVTPQPTTQFFVPDATLRQSVPQALQPVLNAFPLPNDGEDGLNDGLGLYNQSISYPASLDNVSVRLDHSFGEKVKLFWRYSDSPSDTVLYTSPAQGLTQEINIQTITLGATISVTPTQSDDLRFNITQNNSIYSQQSISLGGSVPFSLASVPGPNGQPFPTQGSQFNVCICYDSFPQLTLQRGANKQKQYNVTDTYSWSLGAHDETDFLYHGSERVYITTSSDKDANGGL